MVKIQEWNMHMGIFPTNRTTDRVDEISLFASAQEVRKSIKCEYAITVGMEISLKNAKNIMTCHDTSSKGADRTSFGMALSVRC